MKPNTRRDKLKLEWNPNNLFWREGGEMGWVLLTKVMPDHLERMDVPLQIYS